MPNTGEKPGKGRYRCTKCGQVVVFDNASDTLPPCPKCNNAEFEKVGQEEKMDLLKTNFEDWVGKKPDSESLNTVKKNFLFYFKKVIGIIPFIDQVVALWLMLNDKEYPLIKKGICVFALLYFIMPVDLIPDTIPVAGFLDDAGIISGAIAIYNKDIIEYSANAGNWLKENGFK